MNLPRVTQSPTDPAFVQDPYPFYARARELGRLVFWEEYGLVCTTNFQTTQVVLKDRRFGRAPIDPPAVLPHLADFDAVERHSLLSLEPPAHTRLRKLVLRAFTSRRIKELAPEIETLCHQLIDDFPDGPFDLIPAYANQVPVIIIARLLGVPETMADQLLRWSNAMVAMYQARRSREIEDLANQAAAEFSAFLREYVEIKRRAPADDLISELIAAEENGETLTTDELIATCVLLLNAGHEATVHTMGNGVKALLQNGGADALAPDRVDNTVEEIMRFDPPLHMFTRIAYEDVDLFGHRVKRGEEIACLLAAAAHDPDVHEDPQVFNSARHAPLHLSLGAGLHFCVGAPLARMELQIALPILFQRCPRLRMTDVPQYANLYHFHGLERLVVTAD